MDHAGAVEQHVHRTDPVHARGDGAGIQNVEDRGLEVVGAQVAQRRRVDVGGVNPGTGPREGERAGRPIPCAAAVIRTVFPARSVIVCSLQAA